MQNRNAQARPAFYPACERGHAVSTIDNGHHCGKCWADDHQDDVDAAPSVEATVVDAVPEVVSAVESDETWGLEPLHDKLLDS